MRFFPVGLRTVQLYGPIGAQLAVARNRTKEMRAESSESDSDEENENGCHGPGAADVEFEAANSHTTPPNMR